MINKYNVSYCSNIFKNNNLSELFYNLNKYNTNLNNKKISVCISKKIIKVLNEKKNIKKVITWNKNNNKNINLINGFVYKNFHQKKIKENIYYPDWTKKERLNFTKEIIFFAQKINNKTCGISTLPITYKLWIKNDIKYNIKICMMYFFDLLKILIKIKI
ncbi:MAG TPA: hypothetical protein ACYCDB_00175 [Candidatus Azoamicus sp.]